MKARKHLPQFPSRTLVTSFLTNDSRFSNGALIVHSALVEAVFWYALRLPDGQVVLGVDEILEPAATGDSMWSFAGGDERSCVIYRPHCPGEVLHLCDRRYANMGLNMNGYGLPHATANDRSPINLKAMSAPERADFLSRY